MISDIKRRAVNVAERGFEHVIRTRGEMGCTLSIGSFVTGLEREPDTKPAKIGLSEIKGL